MKKGCGGIHVNDRSGVLGNICKNGTKHKRIIGIYCSRCDLKTISSLMSNFILNLKYHSVLLFILISFNK